MSAYDEDRKIIDGRLHSESWRRGEWIGTSRTRSRRREDQVLEIRVGHPGMECGDYNRLLTYGYICSRRRGTLWKELSVGTPEVLRLHATPKGQKKATMEIVEWFVRKVRRHFNNKSIGLQR